ncbi:MAG: hypothetical protein SNJ71_06645 [Bacteroidales bacterium]
MNELTIRLDSNAKYTNTVSIPVTLFDKTKKQFLQLDITIDTLTKKSEFHYYKNWSSVKDELNLKNKESFPKLTNTSEKLNIKRNFKIIKTTETKVINGFSCNLLLVSEFGKEYKVWYSSEHNYNWLFLNFIYELPGTVIRIERDNNIVLELISIEELSFEKIELSPLDLLKILCDWNEMPGRKNNEAK